MPRWLERIPGFRVAAALRVAQEQLAAQRAELDRMSADSAHVARELRRREAQLKFLKELQAPAMSARRLKEALKTQRDAYRSAQPFPHIVLDDFIEPALLTPEIS